MILGYEQPVEMPTMSIYDKDMMKMYLGALLKDYEQGLQELKEFYKTYGDFVAATKKDAEYWNNNTIGKIQNFVANNPDAMRSVEGRAQIRLLINSIPQAELSNIRATAKAADLYNAAKAKLIAEGKYNPDLEKQTGTYLDDWDSAKQGAFTATSPNSLQTIQELVLPTINELQQSYRYDDALTKQRHDGYRYSTVSNQRVTEALNGNYMDLMNKPSMQYYKNRFMAQNPNATEQDFKNMIFKQVRSQLGEKTEKDDLFFANLDYQHKLALLRQAQAVQRALAEAKRQSKDKNSGDNNQTLYLSNRLGYRAAAQTALDLSPAMSAGKLSAYWKQKASDEKNEDAKKKYENYSKLWSRFNKMSEKEQTKMLETYGLAKNGQLTSKYEKLVSAASGVGATGFKTIQKDGRTYHLNSVASGTAKAILLYNTGTTNVYGTEVEAMAQEVFGNKQKNGFYKVTFGGNIQPLRFRARSTAGIRNSRSGDTVLYNWLKNNKVSGNLFDYSNARTGVKGGNVDMSNLDVTVNLRTMLQFCDYARKHGVLDGYGHKIRSNTADEQILASFGMNVVDYAGNPIKITESMRESVNAKGKKTTSNSKSSSQLEHTYVNIPTNVTMPNEQGSWYSINRRDAKNLGGQKYASDRNEDMVAESIE